MQHSTIFEKKELEIKDIATETTYIYKNLNFFR
jgi:hypothetical protein